MVEILLVKALLEAGLAESIPGVTMDRQCGSGLESIIYMHVEWFKLVQVIFI